MAYTASRAPGRVRRIVVRERAPAFGGRKFGTVGGYECLSGTLLCEADPGHPLNATIVNLDRAPCNARGAVEYEADFTILRPAAAAHGNGWLLYEVVNRGNKLILARLNAAPQTNALATPEQAGDGMLMAAGYTIVWSGWQGDVPPGTDRLGARLPVAGGADGPIIAMSRDEFVPEASGLSTDEFTREVSPDIFVATLSYPAATLDQARARLTVRNRERDPRATPDGLTWRYLDDRHIEIVRPAGYDIGAIYEFVYPARDPVVMGLGLAAIRDAAAFFRDCARDDEGNPNPLAAGEFRNVMGFGASQSGRVLRDLLYEGLNEAGDGRPVFDAVMPVVTGSRRAFVNHAFAQPGRYARQHEDQSFPGNEFPFTYAPMDDPLSGRSGGILDRAEAAGVSPKIIHVDADTELWAGRGSLLGTDCEGRDAAMPANVRMFLAASLPHIPNPPAREGVMQLTSNPVPYTPILRALFVALVEWVELGREPPASRFPARADGTLATLAEAGAAFPAIPGVPFPDAFNELPLFDYSRQPPAEGPRYPVFVPMPDADGNSLGGVRHPLVSVPVATLTGWNLRTAGFGEGDLYSIMGGLVPFARTRAEREAVGDPRPSLEERYGSHEAWAGRLAQACGELVAERLMLAEDADALIARARGGAWTIAELV